MKHADPVAQAEIDRLRAKLARVEALCHDIELSAVTHRHLARVGTREVRAALADPEETR